MSSASTNLPAPPASANIVHPALEQLGVVELVRGLLKADAYTSDITALTCWLEFGGGEGPDQRTVFVKAAFVRHPSRVPGATRQPVEQRANFGVRPGKPFGTVLNKELPEATVSAIYNLAGRYA